MPSDPKLKWRKGEVPEDAPLFFQSGDESYLGLRDRDEGMVALYSHDPLGIDPYDVDRWIPLTEVLEAIDE